MRVAVVMISLLFGSAVLAADSDGPPGTPSMSDAMRGELHWTLMLHNPAREARARSCARRPSDA